jgi:hypothetical protein
MNKTLLTAALALSLASSVYGQAAAASSGPLSDLTVSGSMDYESQYIFRGKKVTNSAFQPSVNFAYPVQGGSLNVYMWTSQPIGRQSNGTPGGNNEIDTGLYWQHAIPGVDNLTGEIGYQMYWYPNGGDGSFAAAAQRTHEFHVGALYDTTSLTSYKVNLSPKVYLYHDVILDSTTLTGSIGYTWDLSDSVGLKGVTLNPGFTLGWTSIGRSFGDVGGQNWNNSFTFWQLDLELDYKLNTSTTFFLAGHYAGNNDGTAGGFGGGNPQAAGSSENQIWLGLGVRFNM